MCNVAYRSGLQSIEGNCLDKLHHPRYVLIQHNKFYWISNRSVVAELVCTVT